MILVSEARGKVGITASAGMVVPTCGFPQAVAPKINPSEKSTK
jgi:hypothetical protein